MDIDWLSTAQAAELLGITPRTLYRLIDAGDIPAYRVGRLIRLQRAHVLDYTERARITPGETPNTPRQR